MPDPSTTVRIPPEIIAGLKRIRDRVGIPVSEQVRRALAEWVDAHDEPREKKGGRRERE